MPKELGDRLMLRREFLAKMGAVVTFAESVSEGLSAAMESPFRVSVINDEIAQDFGRACEIAAH